jgi:hypothetical protein
MAPGVLAGLVHAYGAVMMLNGTNPQTQCHKLGNEFFDEGRFAAVFFAYNG